MEFQIVTRRSRSVPPVGIEELRDELVCPICLELFDHPIILPCSHVLCNSPCAERLFNNGFVRCPVCRDNSFVSGGLDALPRVISLEHIIERYNNGQTAAAARAKSEQKNSDGNHGDEICGQDDIPCQLCEETPVRNKAWRSCLDCNASYCKKCLQVSHPKREPFTQHRLVEPSRYPKPKELRCPEHDEKVNIYCQDCQALGCLLCADGKDGHRSHQILSLDQAASHMRAAIARNIGRLENCQTTLKDVISIYHDKHQEFETNVDDRRSDIHEECNHLIQEVEAKREHFLSDLEYEEKCKSDALMKRIDTLHKQGVCMQSAKCYATEVLKEANAASFLQLAKSVNERVVKGTLGPGELAPPSPSVTTLNHKVVDFRKERGILKDLSYLTVPSTPGIDLSKCSRSTTSVVVVLFPPTNEWDVVDGYKVVYYTEEEKQAGTQQTMLFMTTQEARNLGRGTSGDSAVCLIHDNLSSCTMYYFCVRAFNAAGESDLSSVVNCTTLARDLSEVPVPEINESQCRTYMHSIQIYSSSVVDASAHVETSGVSHFLLYREASANKIWKSIPLFGRLEHRVFGLEPDIMYNFVIMACGKNTECQVSNMVTLHTDRAVF
eukprot:GHVU01119821.1.p1 GENE.GHVU01119821.1~~GHVU01119821.1.p1  ORF type:complete len:609 (-),score=56.35 GHVU01119821.1:1770-3596(-)